ncbi:zinc-binding alcohol dehydrogenase family protein [Catenuloplanes atrovinosus]|uniref:Zinc-type alcohol dehydrogenase-like protein n=1 Tax=Catenuloplanes atrovinosus TaxID=137266 RepID=A0AAE3YYC2_9ACTN|nr:zinc-binding alcohol dehydrogenase family protein [Catenuloplanes atrovinosus]MDR7280464.1 zinc-binding alcohol dehydrogenase family protein [Catenuloplanes atrovinosus]
MSETMRAVAYRRSLPIDHPESLVDVELPVPEPRGHDLLVRVHAVSVNPVDTKVRRGGDPRDGLRVLGFDASGVVVAAGPDVTRFAAGDEVFYAGSIGRSGSDAELHLVDERIAGPKPATLTHAEAAALPLTSITAWEALFEKLRVTRSSTGTLLVVGGAGGVGSMVIQLARRLTGLTVIATASRPESRDWALRMGAHHVIDHRGGLADATLAVVPDGVDLVFTAFSEAAPIGEYERLTAPFGQIVAIDDPETLDVAVLKPKSISWHWELMFTKPLRLPDDDSQHRLLGEVSRLVDAGELRSTITEELAPIGAEALRKAHALVESGTVIGKVVVSGGW